MIFRDWDFIRFFRLAIGIGVIVQAFVAKSWGIGLLGLYFTILPLFNIGCCGSGGCYVPRNRVSERQGEFANKKAE